MHGRLPLTLAAGVALLAGCVNQQTWSPTVDTYGDSRAQYLSRDTEECRALARRAAGGTTAETAKGAVAGGLVGAAAGAAIGAVFGSAGRGAAVGAAAGGIGTGATRAVRSDEEFQRAFKACMRNRGHQVLD